MTRRKSDSSQGTRESDRCRIRDSAEKAAHPRGRPPRRASKRYSRDRERRDKSHPSGTLLRLSKALDVSMAFFFEDEVEMERLLVTRSGER